MANAVKGDLVSNVWFWMTYVPYTGQDYKDSASDDYCKLRWLWEEYVSESRGPDVVSGYSCPRAYQSSDEASLAWKTVKHRFLRHMASLSLAELRKTALEWHRHHQGSLAIESEYYEEINLEFEVEDEEEA